MTNYTKEQLQKIYTKLPEDIKDALFDAGIAQQISNIGKSYSLSTEKIGLLADEIGLVMLGLTKTSDFASTLAAKLKIDAPTAGKIASETNNEVFAKIRSSLIAAQAERAPETSRPAEAATPTPTPQVPQPAPAPVAAMMPKPNLVTLAPMANMPPKEEILREIEDKKDELPVIFQGMTVPQPFAAKTGQEIFRSPMQTTEKPAPTPTPPPPLPPQYQQGKDPYRESAE